MLSGQTLCLLLTLPFFSFTNTGAEDITVSIGEPAFLPCPTMFNLANVTNRISVEWKKDGESTFLCKYFIENNRPGPPNCRPRFNVNTEPLGLNITDVKSGDAGLYTCSVIRLIPPPTLERNSTMRLKVLPSLTLLMNSINSSCVELLCSLQGLPPAQVNFTWTRATQLLLHQESGIMNNTLTICKPNWTDGETLTCQAIYLRDNTLYRKNITLSVDSVFQFEKSRVIIAVISTCAGLLLLVLLGVVVFKCRKRDADRVDYTNKIYENFTFSSATIHPTIPPQNAQPGPRLNNSNTTRYNPQPVSQPQREECIYEN